MGNCGARGSSAIRKFGRPCALSDNVDYDSFDNELRAARGRACDATREQLRKIEIR
jgi:hypothetical protein